MNKRRKDSKGRNLPDGFSERADGIYMSRFTFQGKRYSLYGKNLEELKKKTIREKANLQNSVYLIVDNTTVNRFFEQFMEIYKKPRLKPTTYSHNIRMWELYIKDTVIGRTKIKDLKRIQIIKVLNELYDEKKLASGTMKIITSLLYSCLSEAVNNGIIVRNPADRINKELNRSDRKPKPRAALTEEQQVHFMEFIKQSSLYSVYVPLFCFFLATGCRSGETTGITWNDIDLKSGKISINHTMNYKKLDGEYKFFITTPKTESGKRTIPMIGELKKQLTVQKKHDYEMGIPNTAVIDGYKDFVFKTRKGKPYSTTQINRLILNIIKAYNKKEIRTAEKEQREPMILPHFSAHNLRHTFCTRLCESTTDVKSIQAIMGHKDIQTTLGIYAHSTEKKKAESMAALEEKIKIM